MMIVVTGGSGSGKSEYAETLAAGLGEGRRIYIATMRPFDEECRRRIERHRAMREGKRFETAECYTVMKNLILSGRTSVLLECMSNLTANEMYEKNGAGENTVSEILDGIESIKRQAENVVVVTNEVFSDGITYDLETERYLKYLGIINQRLGEMADCIVESVCSIPVYYKGEEPCLLRV